MKLCLIIQTLILSAILAAGCDHSKPQNEQTPASMAIISQDPIETPDTTSTPVVLSGFPMPLTSGNRIFFTYEGDLTGWTVDRPPNASVRTGLQVYRTDTHGVNWNSNQLPIEQAWEAEVDQDHILASLHQNGSSWLLLQSEPKGDITQKTLYLSEDGGTTWTFNSDLTSSISGFVNSMMVQEDGIRFGTVRSDFIKEKGSDTVYYETIDNGSSWHLFNTASILRFHGNPAALDIIKRFADHWLAQDEQKVRELFVEGASESWIEPMKKHKYTFIGAYPPTNEDKQAPFCVGLRYQIDVKDDSVGTMAICVRKQQSSNEWRVYMFD
ncbi:hypothetical protein WMW72_13050 [Paenibacillus filicis]|uniref:Exo-alpha-sialidase n=1 Tax=Paenibacillus filicis TaxID=669464 RepID=A0ABU9DIY2_9BACL